MFQSVTNEILAEAKRRVRDKCPDREPRILDLMKMVRHIMREQQKHRNPEFQKALNQECGNSGYETYKVHVSDSENVEKIQKKQ